MCHSYHLSSEEMPIFVPQPYFMHDYHHLVGHNSMQFSAFENNDTDDKCPGHSDEDAPSQAAKTNYQTIVTDSVVPICELDIVNNVEVSCYNCIK